MNRSRRTAPIAHFTRRADGDLDRLENEDAAHHDRVMTGIESIVASPNHQALVSARILENSDGDELTFAFVEDTLVLLALERRPPVVVRVRLASDAPSSLTGH